MIYAMADLARLAGALEIRTGVILVAALLAYLLSRRGAPRLRSTFLQGGIVGTLLLPVLFLSLPSLSIRVGDFVSRALEGGAVLVSGFQLTAAGRTEVGAWTLVLMLVPVCWTIGTMVLLARMVYGMHRNGRILRRGRVVESGAMLLLARNLATRLGLKTVPSLIVSDEAAVPFVWGWKRSSVILPAEAESWGAGRIETTLLHEFIHIVRGDQLFLILATIGTALHWPNPLVWLTRRLFRNEAERACDDGVMQQGGLASDYAEHLVAMAAGLARSRAMTPLSMTLLNKSLLEGRLMRILSMNGTARTTRPWALAAAIALLVAVTVGAASIQMQPTMAVNETSQVIPAGTIGAAAGGEEKLPLPEDFVPVETMPEMTHMEPPVYPPEAKEKGIEGTVYVKALVSKTGSVLDVQRGKSSGNESLDKAALVAASKCLYKPALQKGKPVAVWVTYKVDFVLDGDADSAKE